MIRALTLQLVRKFIVSKLYRILCEKVTGAAYLNK